MIWEFVSDIRFPKELAPVSHSLIILADIILNSIIIFKFELSKTLILTY